MGTGARASKNTRHLPNQSGNTPNRDKEFEHVKLQASRESDLYEFEKFSIERSVGKTNVGIRNLADQPSLGPHCTMFLPE